MLSDAPDKSDLDPQEKIVLICQVTMFSDPMGRSGINTPRKNALKCQSSNGLVTAGYTILRSFMLTMVYNALNNLDVAAKSGLDSQGYSVLKS